MLTYAVCPAHNVLPFTSLLLATFNKMRQLLLIFAVLIFLRNTQACSVRNVSCYDIKNNGGYRYTMNSTVMATRILVSQNGTNVGFGGLDKDFTFTEDVVQMDNDSVITFECLSVQIKYYIYSKGHEISEICESFDIIEKETFRGALYSSTAWKPIDAVAVAAAFAVILFCIALGYIPWKKKWKGQDAATFPVYLKQLLTCFCFRKGISVEENGDGHISLNDTNQNQTGDGGQGQPLLRTDNSSECNDGATLRINMDHGLTTTNGYTSLPGVIGAVVCQGTTRNMGHVPGGGKANNDECSNEKILNEGTLGEQSPEGHESKGQLLPCSQRAARLDFDENGETEALVNMLGSGSECTTPPHDKEKGVTTKEEL